MVAVVVLVTSTSAAAGRHNFAYRTAAMIPPTDHQCSVAVSDRDHVIVMMGQGRDIATDRDRETIQHGAEGHHMIAIGQGQNDISQAYARTKSNDINLSISCCCHTYPFPVW